MLCLELLRHATTDLYIGLLTNVIRRIEELEDGECLIRVDIGGRDMGSKEMVDRRWT